MMKTKFLFSLILISFIPMISWGQEAFLLDFNEARLDLNHSGMQILGTWAAGNMIWSATQLGNTDPLKRSYHQMNLAWNGVNLGIAAFGYFQGLDGDLAKTLAYTLDEQYSIEKILLLNAGLDLAYMAGGWYLMERSKSAKEPYQLNGFGRAVIVNGAFLFLFDIILHQVHVHHREELVPWLEQIDLSFNANQVGLSLRF